VPWTFKLTKDYSDVDIATCLRNLPLVVKPHNASLSWGVMLNVVNEQQLRDAIEAALAFSPGVLVQEQVEGEELRFTVVDGVVKAALLREMSRLVGDGESTAKQLLERENEARAELTMPYLTYPQLSPALIHEAGREESDVLDTDEVLQLGRGTMIRTGASIYNVLTQVHSSYLETARKLADSLGARFIVVDMMIHDYTQPQSVGNYAFIEFNTAPVLKMFYSCRDGNHYDILGDLVPMIDATLTTGAKHE
jgi:D-alanine-D-alanine ligase-like ATP-grasp enzyme